MKTHLHACLAFCLFFLSQSPLFAQDAATLITEGKGLHDGGDYAGAITKFDAAIAAEASNGNTYYLRGRSKAAKQDDKGALADFNKAMEMGESNGELYRLKAFSECFTGNKEQGCKDFSKAIELGDGQAEDMKERFCK